MHNLLGRARLPAPQQGNFVIFINMASCDQQPQIEEEVIEIKPDKNISGLCADLIAEQLEKGEKFRFIGKDVDVVITKVGDKK